jgi:tetratricopeptide (TPR) repeat protein
MLRSSKAELVYAGTVFFAALFIYSWTLAPTVTLVDSGELIVAARFLGVAHPPGFPLYLLLAHLVSLVPIGSVAMRINFASALFAALACAMLTLVVAELIITASFLTALKRRQRAARKAKKRSGHSFGREADEDSMSHWLMVISPAIGSGLLLTFSRTLLSYATIAEVYTLNTFLILVIIFLILRWRRRILEDERHTNPSVGPRRRRSAIADYDSLLYAGAVVFGLALGVHHVTVALILPSLAVIVYRTEGFRFFTSKRLLYAALFSFAALLAAYSYLPLAASGTPILNWGNPRSFEKIWAHITGKQYQTFLSFDPKVMGEQLGEFGKIVLAEFGPRWLPLGVAFAVAGYAHVFRRDRTTFWFLTIIVVSDVAYAVSYDIAEDKDAYYLPAFVSVTIAAGLGFRWLLQNVFLRTPARAMQFLLALPLLGVPAIALAANWPFNNRSHYFIAHDYIENIQSTIEPNGLLLSLDWQVVSPALYTREIEQRRRDVKVVDVQLLRRSWYMDYLGRAYPGLIERSRDKVDAFVAELKHWEHDPEAYAKSATLTRGIASAFQEMFQSFVTKELEVAPVYITSDLVRTAEEQYKEQVQWLTSNYQPTPRGLVFQLAADRGFHDPGAMHLQTRGLADGTLTFASDDVVNLKVLPVYRAMFVTRGRYLAFFGRHERAIDAFQQALAFDPSLESARQGLNESIGKLRKSQISPP